MLLNPLGTLTVVRVNGFARDPALADDMDLKTYDDTRDPALIREKPGHTAARFELSPLDAMFVAEHIDSARSDSMRQMNAFLASCHAYTKPTGERVSAKVTPAAYGQAVADVEWVREIASQFGMSTVYELGALAWFRTRLPRSAEAPFA